MTRSYAALPHEYLEEMSELDDAEFGRLVRALLKYSIAGEVVTLSGNERFYYRRVMMREDRYQDSYDELSRKRSEAGRKGAQSRWGYDGKDSNTEAEAKAKNKTKNKSLPSTDGKSSAAGRMKKDIAALETARRKEESGA